MPTTTPRCSPCGRFSPTPPPSTATAWAPGRQGSNTLATAKYGGVRGNDITIVVAANVDEPDLWDVTTYVDGVAADTQTVEDAEALVSNDWVDFKTEATCPHLPGCL